MSKADRNNPRRSKASESRYSIFEFEREFPDDAACLQWLVEHRYPKGVYCPTCERVTKHHREKSRPSFSCQFCGHREHPMVGTIFENSATSLRLWFYAIYLMASTRCGISAKQMERELGVTYKTAWRMCTQIRSLFEQDNGQLSGKVEVDETYVGGKPRLKDRPRKSDGSIRMGRSDKPKVTVFGAVERKGRVRAQVVPNDDKGGIPRRVSEFVQADAVLYSDEYVGYDRPGRNFREHHRIRHAQRIYVSGDVHTQTIEGFWSLVKNGLRGVYHSVGPQHLQSYVDEYVFRYNNREHRGRGMFTAMMNQIPGASSERPS